MTTTEVSAVATESFTPLETDDIEARRIPAIKVLRSCLPELDGCWLKISHIDAFPGDIGRGPEFCGFMGKGDIVALGSLTEIRTAYRSEVDVESSCVKHRMMKVMGAGPDRVADGTTMMGIGDGLDSFFPGILEQGNDCVIFISRTPTNGRDDGIRWLNLYIARDGKVPVKGWPSIRAWLRTQSVDIRLKRVLGE